MRSVLPGVAEVLARPLWLQSMLMRLDLPTFERPMKAYSGRKSLGQLSIVGLLRVNTDVLMSITKNLSAKIRKKNESSANFH